MVNKRFTYTQLAPIKTQANLNRNYKITVLVESQQKWPLSCRRLSIDRRQLTNIINNTHSVFLHTASLSPKALMHRGKNFQLYNAHFSYIMKLIITFVLACRPTAVTYSANIFQ